MQGAGLFTGHFATIVKEPTGEPHLRWAAEVPNDGMIRYTGLFNIERVFLTSPKALSEILVQRPYDFVKPGRIQQTIGRILGIGILFAEGNEHKVCRAVHAACRPPAPFG